MKLNRRFVILETLLLALVLLLTGAGNRLCADTGNCGRQTITNRQSEDGAAPRAFFPPAPF
jgi:hypothetical protein